MSVPVIGVSLLESIDALKRPEIRLEDATEGQRFDGVPYHPSLLDSLLPRTDRLLLQGPLKSGLSSLLLELAFSLASRTPCRCSDMPCRCTSVWLIRPAVRSPEEDCFPISCRQLDPSTENDQQPSAASFPRSLLHRIEVHHISHSRDVYKRLLQVQGLPRSKQPWGGILVDDVDCLSGADSALGACPRLSQMVALLTDTARFLDRAKRSVDPSPTRLSLTLHQQSLVLGCSRILSCLGFGNPSMWEVRPLTTSSALGLPPLRRLTGGRQEMTAQCFEIVPAEATKVALTPTFPPDTPSPTSKSLGPSEAQWHAYYAILPTSDEGESIVWRVLR